MSPTSNTYGLAWTSYSNNSGINASHFLYDMPSLYAAAIQYFNSSPPIIASGIVGSIQTDSIYNSASPSFSTFSHGGTDYTAVEFNGFMCPDNTGYWSFFLGTNGYCSDDFGILFIGPPRAPIVPDATYSSSSSVPSSTTPVLYNAYWQDSSHQSVTLYLEAGLWYPLKFLYSQGDGGYVMGLSFSFDFSNIVSEFSTYFHSSAPICFKEDTQILTDQGYRRIQDLRKGDLVKTRKFGYKPIDSIGKRSMYHRALEERVKDQLYICRSSEYPEIFEDLVITGCHSILVDDFVDESQRQKTIDTLGKIYVTDNKYRLPACVDERAKVYEPPGKYTIYHLALENDDYYMNYGIYANGLHVETCSKRYLRELTSMDLIV